MNAPVKPPIRREAMRIAGKRVETDGVVEVKDRRSGERHDLAVADAAQALRALVRP